jgi:hypothetical protein
MKVSAEPGTTVDVVINGKSYPTVVDKDKVQRFAYPDALLIKLKETNILDIEILFLGPLTNDEVREFIRRTGHSLNYYFEYFPEDLCENPLEVD